MVGVVRDRRRGKASQVVAKRNSCKTIVISVKRNRQTGLSKLEGTSCSTHLRSSRKQNRFVWEKKINRTDYNRFKQFDRNAQISIFRLRTGNWKQRSSSHSGCHQLCYLQMWSSDAEHVLQDRPQVCQAEIDHSAQRNHPWRQSLGEWWRPQTNHRVCDPCRNKNRCLAHVDSRRRENARRLRISEYLYRSLTSLEIMEIWYKGEHRGLQGSFI